VANSGLVACFRFDLVGVRLLLVREFALRRFFA